MTTIFFEDSINSAHFLPMMPEGHKCRRMHGHTYKIYIEVGGKVGADGIIVDYDVIRKAWKPFFDMIDHTVLNEVQGLENPTCENIAMWIARGMDHALAPAFWIEAVTVRETERCGATVRLIPRPQRAPGLSPVRP